MRRWFRASTRCISSSTRATRHSCARFWSRSRPPEGLDVYPASTCARVVASGGCNAPPPETAAPAIDPEDACQEALEAELVVHRAHPLNCETSIPALLGGVVMPNAHFYVRNHFQIPKLDPKTYRLSVDGLVDRELALSIADLRNLKSDASTVTLECAGNGRALFDPAIVGEKWHLGAVSTAEWTGVPLAEVFDRAGVRPSAREVIFRGADGGTIDGVPDRIRFERSLTVDQARNADILLAYGMNGEALPTQHGYPVRLIVPDWYAVRVGQVAHRDRDHRRALHRPLSARQVLV